jgi:hypothetical protein
MTAVLKQKFKPRAHLAIAALVSFILAFVVARTFTTFFPSTVLVSNGIHIHHFWYGIVLLAIGGWLGISFNDKDTDRLAAILSGAGGGLIVDEVGLLLTFGNYWTSLTYTFLTVFLAFIFVLILFNLYREIIVEEFKEFLGSNASIYFGVFLFAISVAFITQTSNVLVVATSSALATAALVICLAYIVLWLRKYLRMQENNEPNTLLK